MKRDNIVGKNLSAIVEDRQKSQFCYLEKGVFELNWAATIKLRKIECSGFFYWTTTDKLEFTDWSQVNRMFICGEIAINPFCPGGRWSFFSLGGVNLTHNAFLGLIRP